MNLCPCGSGHSAGDCCLAIIHGLRPAATAEELMRARYSAYATVAIDFITASTHPEQRHRYNAAGARQWAEQSQWLGLEIIACTGGGREDRQGTVEFVARFRDKAGEQRHHERASFARHDGQWYFVNGEQVKPQPAVSNKTGRNDPCPCGSGAKFKKCCGR